MTEEYRVVLGQQACDVCQSMENTYPYPPGVPFHPHCDCQVETTGQPNGDCSRELRNVRTHEIQYSEPQTFTAEVDTRGRGDTPVSVPVEMRLMHESWDDPALKEACGWSPPSGTRPAAFTVPGDSIGSILITAEVEITQIMCRAEEWEVCRRPPAPSGPGGTSGYGHTLSERMIRTVGGGAAAVTGIISTDFEFLHDSQEYYEDDDEVPA